MGTRVICIIPAIVMTGLVCRGADPESSSVDAFVQAKGGEVLRGQDGRVTEVSLARTWATDRDLERILEIQDLKRLNLALTYVSDRGVERLQKLEQLEELNLDTAEFITDAAMAFLRSNSRLRRLNLRGTEVTDKGLEYVASLKNLTYLNIGETQVSDIGLEHLAALSNLESLDLGGIRISGVGLDVLKLLPGLKKLSLKGIQRVNAGVCWAPAVTDADLETISLLTGLEDLNLGWGVGLGLPDPLAPKRPLSELDCHLNGAGIRVTDVGLDKLAALKQLRRLDLSGSSITADGLKELSALPRLEQISLWNVKSLDDSAGAALATLRNLGSLDLSGTAVGDGIFRSLAALPRLHNLYLTDTRVTAAGLDEFHRRKPACVVSWADRTAGPQP